MPVDGRRAGRTSQRFGVAGRGPDEVVDPFLATGEARRADDLRAHGIDIDDGPSHRDLPVPQQRPVPARPAIRHADAARVDHQAPIDEAGERHVGMPAHDRLHLAGQPIEDLSPPLEATVDENDSLVITRCPMAEHHRTEPFDLQDHRMRQPRQQVDVLR